MKFEVFKVESNLYSKIKIILRELYKELYFVPDFVHLKAVIAYVAPSLFPIRGK